jgi:hypothetical protein
VAAAGTINGIQESQAISKIAEAYNAARESAQAYLDTVRRQNQRTLDGMGMGSEYRADQSARNQIEDKFIAKRSSLDEGLSRLMQEKATGKDRIENARKIMEAQAAIGKIRQDAATAGTITITPNSNAFTRAIP